MSVAVIGASGFIGGRLCARLTADQPSERLHAVGRTGSDPTSHLGHLGAVADVRSVDALSAAIPTAAAIVNLAAEHRDDVRPVARYDEVNVGGARNVCTAARRRGTSKIVFASSVAVYGFARPGTGENDALAPHDRFGESKVAAEDVYRQWQAEQPEERTLVIVRPAPVFGEGGRGNIARLLRQIAASKFVMIGDGRNIKSLAYVENLAAFLAFCLGFGPGVHVYNYVDKPDMTMNELVAFVRRGLGQKARDGFRVPYPVALTAAAVVDGVARFTGREFAVSALRVRKFCANTSFASAVAATGFVAPVSLEQGLAATLRSMRQSSMTRS